MHGIDVDVQIEVEFKDFLKKRVTRDLVLESVKDQFGCVGEWKSRLGVEQDRRSCHEAIMEQGRRDCAGDYCRMSMWTVTGLEEPHCKLASMT